MVPGFHGGTTETFAKGIEPASDGLERRCFPMAPGEGTPVLTCKSTIIKFPSSTSQYPFASI